MAENGESLGVVSGAYFVGRAHILQWINELTSFNYSKIEETASGVAACHVFDALYPGSIRMERVKFDAKRSYEYVNNYKLLQECFNRNKLKRQIDIQSLVRGKYQDNLEFMQWLKAYYDQHASEDALNYDGRARREQICLQRPHSASTPTSAAPSRTVANARATQGPGRPARAPTTRPAATPRTAARTVPRPGPGAAAAPSPRTRAAPGASAVQLRQLREEVEGLRKDNTALEDQIVNLESEREFYFSKLRQVEIVVQGVEAELEQPDVDPLEPLRHALDDIRHHLYAEEGEEGAPLVEEGPVVEGDEAAYADEELRDDPAYQASPTAT